MLTVSVENAGCVLAEIEKEAKRILGSFGPKEHDALSMAKISNGGHMNHVFDQMGVPYAPRPIPDSEAFEVATKK
jgi:hypothetical protein